MQLFQQTQQPKVKLSSIVPKKYGTTFIITFEKKPIDLREFRYQAEVLAEHMDIVAESRRIINAGKTMIWEEFYKTHASNRDKRI